MAEGGGYRHGEFVWEELGTRVPDEAREFYSNLAGWDVREDDMPQGGVYYSFTDEHGERAGMYEMIGEHFEGVPSHWMTYVRVDDVDRTVAEAREMGAEVAQEPFDVPGVGRVAYLVDPQGAMFGVMHNTDHPGMARGEPVRGSFHWFELVTPDDEAAKAFYAELFGWQPHTADMGGMNYTSWMQGDRGVGGMMKMEGAQWEGIPPHWMPYLTVEDIERAVETVEEKGGEIRVPPTAVPDVGRFAVVSDPGGAVVSVIQYEMSEEEAG